MAAEELLTKALLSMKRGDCLSHTSQLLHGALALSPTKAEASYWHAMLLEQMYEEKQALECGSSYTLGTTLLLSHVRSALVSNSLQATTAAVSFIWADTIELSKSNLERTAELVKDATGFVHHGNVEQALALRPTKTWRKKLMAELPSLSILICLCAGAEDGLCLLFGNHNHTTESFEEMW